MEPLLDIVGLRGVPTLCIWEGHRALGDSTDWVHLPVGSVTESSCLFDVSECVDELVFKSGSGVLIDGTVGSVVYK